MTKVGIPVDRATLVQIDYTNWRGERGKRNITPIGTWFGKTDWHNVPQWFMKAMDQDKKQIRDFALKDIHSWTPQSYQTKHAGIRK